MFQTAPKPCIFKGSRARRNTKGNWELIFEISCAYYRSQTIGNGKVVWTGSHLFRHDICFLSISSFCGSASQSFDCHSLREGERPRAIAFIYRDRLIWVYCFRQRRLRCTQGNSSCKTSYEYETLAEFYIVIVYLLSTLSFAPIFCVPCFLEPLKSQGFRPFWNTKTNLA